MIKHPGIIFVYEEYQKILQMINRMKFAASLELTNTSFINEHSATQFR